MFEQINEQIRINKLEETIKDCDLSLHRKLRTKEAPINKLSGKCIKEVKPSNGGVILKYTDGTFTYLRPYIDDGYPCFEPDIPEIDEAERVGLLSEDDLLAYRAAEDAYYKATQRQRDVANFLKLADRIGPGAKDLL